jgi:hypothetical protein
MSTPEIPAAGEVFDAQKLLFGLAKPITEPNPIDVPDDFYEHGWTVIDGVPDEFEALSIQEDLIRSIDPARVPLHARFRDRIQLAKADQIPVCDPVVATSLQVQHFDMGHPFTENADPLFVSHAGVYRSPDKQEPQAARTRILPLAGLVALSAVEADRRLAEYAAAHGDGWPGHNSGRINAGVRLIDALSDTPELQAEIDKPVDQWFGDDVVSEDVAFAREAAFYARHGIDLASLESRVALQPGQLLFLDNTRVLHGRIGNRAAKEVFNFMFGVEAIRPRDIQAVRQSISQLLVSR